MAAKTIEEAIAKIGIRSEIQKCLCIGPSFELHSRIEWTSKNIEKVIRDEMRDLFSHRCQVFGHKNKCDVEIKAFFDEIFGEVIHEKKD